MLTKKRITTALACAVALGVSGAALATPITVEGITWDPADGSDLTIQSLNLRETPVSNVGDVLHGYGQIGSINGNNSFCTGCALTFTFTYTVLSATPNADGSTQVVFDGGNFQFYVQNPGIYNWSNPSSAAQGTPWLTMTGHEFIPQGYTVVPGGQLYSKVFGTVSSPDSGSSGYGLVDVTGGPAAEWMNSNFWADGLGGFADFKLNSSFQYFPFNNCGSTPTTNLDNVCSYPIEGNGHLVGRSVAVPEPGEVGLLGLGVGLLGFFMWRRRKETDARK